MPGHGGEEGLALERVQPDAADGGAGRRPGHVLEERDLAEAVAAAEPAELPAAGGALHLALGDHVEAVADVALRDQHVTGGGVDRDQASRQALDRRRGQLLQERHGPEQRDLHHRHRRRGVDLEQRLAAEQDGQRQHRSGPDHRRLRAEHRHEHGYEQGAGGDAGRRDAFEQAEDARDDVCGSTSAAAASGRRRRRACS